MKKEKELFVFTAMSGIFPGADTVDRLWDRIVRADPAPLLPLQGYWGLDRQVYFDGNVGTPNKTYLDRAFCFDNEAIYPGRQVAFGKKVLENLLDGVRAGQAGFTATDTALVLGTSWSDYGYMMQDIDCLFNGAGAVRQTFSPDEQLQQLMKACSDERLHFGCGIAVDTACASSLYALDAAINLVESGQAKNAVVLAMNASIPVQLFTSFSQLTALSHQGRFLPFSAEADGIIPGEACCAVLIEKLEDALRQNRKILGVIRSLGLSSDGEEGGVFAPGLQGQLMAYRRAYEGFPDMRVDYIEAHGTATKVGDATELRSLQEFFAPVADGNKIPIGSIKSIVGHTLASAGMTAVIKSLLMIRNKMIPPHIPVTPHESLERTCLMLPASPVPVSTPLRIGVSAFGFGGANAHLVVESYQEEAGGKSAGFSHPGQNRGAGDDIALIDFEAAYGNAIGSDGIDALFGNGEPRYEKLSRKRFHRDVQGARGLFFPDEIAVDGLGLKKGPNFIKMIDTFQNLVSHLVNQLVRRNAALAQSAGTAFLMCNNMGGAKGLHLNRKRHLLNTLGNTDELQQPQIEEIASGLGSMLSGYPASYFNFRGYHATYSGDERAFLQLLLAAPRMLQKEYRTLLLGAGNIVKSPVDFHAPGLRGPEGKMMVEGAAVFVLKKYEDAISDKDRVLAVLHYDDKAGQDDRLPRFRIAGPAGGYRVEGDGYRYADWYLGEASGTELLTHLLVNDIGRALIECSHGNARTSRIIFERKNDAGSGPLELRNPITVSFCDALSGMSIPEKPARGERRPVTKPEKDRGIPAFMNWHRNVASVIDVHYDVQSHLLSMVRAAGEAGDGAPGDRMRGADDGFHFLSKYAENNVLIDDVMYDRDTDRYTAFLRINEEHPYFYDHQLDHVPGIMLLAGAQQLVEAVTGAMQCHQGEAQPFINSLDISFKKWCEKHTQVTLQMLNSKSENAVHVSITQADAAVTDISLTYGESRPEKQAGSAGPGKGCVLPPARYIHKKREENILISDVYRDGEWYVCDLVKPGTDHYFNDGDDACYPIVYLLETARQCGMLIVHKVQDVPLSTQMALLSITVSIDKPLYKNGHYCLRTKLEEGAQLGTMTIGSMELFLHDRAGQVGSIALTTMLVDSDQYKKNRRGTNHE